MKQRVYEILYRELVENYANSKGRTNTADFWLTISATVSYTHLHYRRRRSNERRTQRLPDIWSAIPSGIHHDTERGTNDSQFLRKIITILYSRGYL